MTETKPTKWYAENYSKQHADDWYLGIAAAIRSLKHNPERCALIHENSRLSMDVRALLYGKSKQHRHRIPYTIDGDTVFILRIRHSAQRDIEAGDLPEIQS